MEDLIYQRAVITEMVHQEIPDTTVGCVRADLRGQWSNSSSVARVTF